MFMENFNKSPDWNAEASIYSRTNVESHDEVIPDSAFPELENCKLGCEHEYNRCISSGVYELDCFDELSTCFEQCRNKKRLY